jgi:hypothetical protein
MRVGTGPGSNLMTLDRSTGEAVRMLKRGPREGGWVGAIWGAVTKYMHILSTTVYVPSSELGLPHLLSLKRVCPPQPKGGGILASKSTNERGERRPSLVGSLGPPCRYKRLLSCLGCSGQPSTKFSSPYNISIYVSLSPSNLGRQSCWAACL